MEPLSAVRKESNMSKDDDDEALRSINLADLSKWMEAHPATVLNGEFRIHLRLADLKCGECGAKADGIHFITAGRSAPAGVDDPVTVEFSCSKHDLGGYSVDLGSFV